MLQYLIKRILLLFVTLFGITVITFILTRLTPGDPAAMRIPGAGGGGGKAVVAFRDLVEQNRRNLGLDKPKLINLDFEDREFVAKRALDDYLRHEEFWQRDSEKQLLRVSTVALKPALERYPLIGTPNEPKPLDNEGKPKQMDPSETQKVRLAKLLPFLAASKEVEGAPTEPDEAYAFWKKWYEENKSRFDEANVSKTVKSYMEASEADSVAIQGDVLRLGGYAMPYLMEYLGSSDINTLYRLNVALETQTGFNFVSGGREGFIKEHESVMRSWRSWWRREQIRYSSFGPVGNAVNIFANTQFGLWVSQAMRFDFGESYIKKKPVITLMARALPVSMLLSVASIIVSYIIAIPLGIFSAIKKNTPADRVITVTLFILYSLPTFWVGVMSILLLTGKPMLDLFPSRGFNSPDIEYGVTPFGAFLTDRIWHLVLPVICLSYGSVAFISRQMRAAMLETINQDFIRTAKAKGLDWRSVVFKHALRNSLIPILTISAGLLPELIAGAIIIESIFTIPGMGTLTFEAIVNRDYPIINAVLFFSAFLTLLGILLADISYALVDPRISYN